MARPEDKALQQPGAVHHVREGETLWRIAKTYAVPLEVVLRENALENPAQLAAGTSLFIPCAEHELTVPPASVQPAFATRMPRIPSPCFHPRPRGPPPDPA